MGRSKIEEFRRREIEARLHTLVVEDVFMRDAGSVDLNARPVVKTWAALPRPCEKASDSSDLGQEQPDLQPDRRKGQPTLRVQLVSQNNTSRPDPIWEGPRLVPAFAAQVMGQAMLDRREATARVETAYGSIGRLRMALLLDRKS